MKSATICSLFLVLTLLVSLSCSRPEPAPTDSLANTQWYGTFAYTGEATLRVFTIQFSSGNDFVWQDLSGSYSGKWARTDNDVTITFTINGIQTSFRLVGTNQLTNPKNLNHTTWTIKQLARIEATDALKISTVLPKTKWAGSLELWFDEDMPNTLLFQPGTTSSRGRGDYTTSGPVIQISNAHWNASFNILFFGVFISDKTLIGNFQQKSFSQTTYKTLPLEEFTRK